MKILAMYFPFKGNGRPENYENKTIVRPFISIGDLLLFTSMRTMNEAARLIEDHIAWFL
jgi:hypothetical protein